MDKKTKRNLSIHVPEEIDRYLAKLPEDMRVALEKMRMIIRELVPDATERVSYGVPIFRLHKDLVGLGVSKNMCSFYVMSPALVQAMKEELSGYKVSGGTIHFKPETILSRAVIEKIIRARIEEQNLQ